MMKQLKKLFKILKPLLAVFNIFNKESKNKTVIEPTLESLTTLTLTELKDKDRVKTVLSGSVIIGKTKYSAVESTYNTETENLKDKVINRLKKQIDEEIKNKNKNKKD